MWNFNDDFRVARPGTDPDETGPGRGANWTTMPQYFKNMGYQVYGAGKTYHPNRPMNNDLPLSWNAYGGGTANRSCNNGRPVYETARDNTTGQGFEWKRIVACEENDSESLLTSAAIEYLRLAASGTGPLGKRPFFVAMGHHKPHLPWWSPSRFIDQYGDPTQYPVAAVQAYPPTASTNQWHPWFDQTLTTDIEPVKKQHYLRRGYYASVSYYDHHFGRMIDALEESGKAEDTVVLVTGDHVGAPHYLRRSPSASNTTLPRPKRLPLRARFPFSQGFKS
eukprot:SAG22_NODE_800_length_7109_cov_47.259058_5_plen_279_part_00